MLGARPPDSASALRVDWSAFPGSAVLYGSGIGIWNGEREFMLNPAVVGGIFGEARSLGYCDMPDDFGRKEWEERSQRVHAEGGPSFDIAGPPVLGWVELARGSYSRRVTQYNGAIEPSESLAEIARHVLRTAKRAAESGVAAMDIVDGLGKIARSQLVVVPETFRLSVTHGLSTPPPQSADGAYKWTLIVTGREVEGRSFSLQEGKGGSYRRVLSDSDLQELVRLLRGNIATLPDTIYLCDGTEPMTSLDVAVLDQRCAVKTTVSLSSLERSSAAQKARLRRVLDGLGRLHARWIREATAPSN